MAEASSHLAQESHSGNELKKYMKLCTKKLFSQQSEDFTSDFYETLQLSYKTASSHKNKTSTELSCEVLKDIEDRLSDLYKKVTEGKTNFNNILALATSYCNMGILYNSYKNEKNLRSGKTHLKRSLELLNGKELKCRAILIVMRASVQLEYICKQLREPMECCPFTHKAIGFYLEYTTQLSSFPMPFITLSVSLDVEDSGNTNTINAMNTLYLKLLKHVQTCQFLEWEDPLDLIPIHNFLMNRLTVMLDKLKVLHEGIIWANNATDYYVHFLSKYRFSDARNYLAATQYILDEYEKKFNAAMAKARRLQKGEVIQKLLEKDTDYKNLRKQLLHGWANYGNAILFHSKYKLFYSQKSRTEKDTSRSTSSLESKESTEPLTFTWENLDERIKDIAKLVTDKNVSTLRDAKEVFDYTKKWFKKSKEHYNKSLPRKHERYNVTLTYKYLECFEPDRNERIKLHQKRKKKLQKIFPPDFGRKQSIKHKYSDKFYLDIFVSCGAIIDLMMENGEIAEKPFTEIHTDVLEYVKTWVDYYKHYTRSNQSSTKVKMKVKHD